MIVSTIRSTSWVSASGAFFCVDSGWPTLQLSRYRATALRPSRHDSRYSYSTSSTLASSGMFTVLLIAPEMNGCTAAIIFT